MASRFIIRPAATTGAESLRRIRGANESHGPDLNRLIPDGCVLVAELGGEPFGFITLDLDTEFISGPWIRPDHRGRGARRRLLTEIEKLASRFGLTRLAVTDPAVSSGFFEACGYRHAGDSSLHRSISRRQTRYGRRISALLEELGIPADYARRHRLPLQQECGQLVSIGPDIYGRDQKLHPRAAQAWLAMQAHAQQDEVELQAVSAYRSADYQAGIVRRKLEQGQSMDVILRSSTAPGYSEHHTGRALDIATPGFAVLEEEFESSPAFEWLKRHADEFGFTLSYPRDNRHKVAFEPWHWAFSPRS